MRRFPWRRAAAIFASNGPEAIEGAIAHLRAKGVSIEVGPVPRNGVKGPGRSVYFRDRDGSLMEFNSYAEPA